MAKENLSLQVKMHCVRKKSRLTNEGKERQHKIDNIQEKIGETLEERKKHYIESN